MKYLGTLKHWSPYLFAFWIEIITTRAQLFFCFPGKDYGCIFGNLMIIAWCVLAVSVLRYSYLRQKSKQANTEKAHPSMDGK